MKLIGVTGGIGSGKSTVCKILETLGFPVYYSDDRAKYLQQTDPEIVQETKALFGENAYIQGELNRSFIAQQVFAKPALRQQLNAIVHPRVKADFEAWKQQQKSNCLFQESALIYEINRQGIYNQVILVTAPENIRVQRTMVRDEVSEETVKMRIAAQLSDDEKRQFAPHEIVNDDKHPLLEQVLEFLKQEGCYSTSS